MNDAVTLRPATGWAQISKPADSSFIPKEIHMSNDIETIDLPDLDFAGLEVMSVREAVAVPETGATSGSSSCTSTSCCGSSSCCSSGSCG